MLTNVFPQNRKNKTRHKYYKAGRDTKKESPEKIRLILSYLDPKKADEIFKHLPEDVKHQVLKL